MFFAKLQQKHTEKRSSYDTYVLLLMIYCKGSRVGGSGNNITKFYGSWSFAAIIKLQIRPYNYISADIYQLKPIFNHRETVKQNLPRATSVHISIASLEASAPAFRV